MAVLQQLRARFEAFTAAPTPVLAVEIAAGHVAAGRRQGSGSGKLEGVRVGARALAPGLVRASAAQANLADAAAIAAELRPLLGALEGAGGEVTLLLPDLTARLAVLSFDALPAKTAELEPLARFRLRKSLPFAETQAVMSCQPLSGTKLLVAFADRARVDEYENCLEAAGAHAATVLPSGLACLAAHAALEDASLLLRADSGCLTSAFCRQGRVEFFRALEIGAAVDFDAVFPSVAYFRDDWEACGHAGEPLLFTAGLSEGLRQQLAEEAPWARLREAEAAVAVLPDSVQESGALLAVAGALRGRFV
ncbi:MAG: hypothetical protein ACRD04_14430 [Terriglobales bacterium]